MIPIATTLVSVLRGTNDILEHVDKDPWGTGYSDPITLKITPSQSIFPALSVYPAAGSRGKPPTPAQGWQIIASHVRAIIGSPQGNEQVVQGGESTIITYKFMCDPVDCTHTDKLLDESTNIVYSVTWVFDRSEFGISRTTGGLKRIEGRAI